MSHPSFTAAASNEHCGLIDYGHTGVVHALVVAVGEDGQVLEGGPIVGADLDIPAPRPLTPSDYQACPVGKVPAAKCPVIEMLSTLSKCCDFHEGLTHCQW